MPNFLGIRSFPPLELLQKVMGQTGRRSPIFTHGGASGRFQSKNTILPRGRRFDTDGSFAIIHRRGHGPLPGSLATDRLSSGGRISGGDLGGSSVLFEGGRGGTVAPVEVGVATEEFVVGVVGFVAGAAGEGHGCCERAGHGCWV